VTDTDYLQRILDARATLQGPAPEAEYERLERDHDQLESALEAASPKDPRLALEAAALLRGYWVHRGRAAEGRRWLERLLAAVGDGPSPAHATGLAALATIAFRQGDNAVAKASSEAAIAEAQQLDRPDIELDGLLRRAEEGLRDQDPEATIAYATRARALALALGDERQELSALHRLAEGTRISGDVAAARPLYVESLERNRARGDRVMVAVESINLGFVEQAGGNLARAETLIREAIATASESGSVYLLCAGLVGLAGVLAETGRAEGAALVIGHADARFERAGLVPDPADQPGYDRAAAAARATLGDEAYARGHERGSGMETDAVLAAVA
jgi:non-specific serine/threonine protein kinase